MDFTDSCLSTLKYLIYNNWLRSRSAQGVANDARALILYSKFVPLAFEMSGCWEADALALVKEMGRSLKEMGTRLAPGLT